MQTNTFTEALEVAFQECWRQGEYLEAVEKGEVKFGGSKEDAYDSIWRETLGAQKVLAALLHARGEVGRKGFPADPERFLPCIQQTWIRLMQWGVRKGLTTPDKIDDVVTTYPQYAQAMENLGRDVETTDFRLPSSEDGEKANA